MGSRRFTALAVIAVKFLHHFYNFPPNYLQQFNVQFYNLTSVNFIGGENMDIIYLGGAALLLVLLVGMVLGCDRLMRGGREPRGAAKINRDALPSGADESGVRT